ncbi:hypothetical protein TcWFU_009214 [Taenia crassiceps]|uniref:SUN domain-containing protein n=1 Tax=Taenia crassiceps TaxID=6207 RepID=A0ABR4Q2H7_9CEST
MILWLYLTLFCLIGAVGRQRERGEYAKNPTWSVRGRNAFVKRWREGVRQLYLSDQSQWPDVLKLHTNIRWFPKTVNGMSNIGGSSASKTMATLQPSRLRNGDALPPMDESVVNELSQPNMPTFQEFHAKVLGENQNKRRLESPDDSGNVISSQSNKDNLGSTVHSNLSKHPYRNDEGVAHDSSVLPATGTEATTSNPSPIGTDAFIAASEIIHSSNVMETVGNGGSNAKRLQGTGQELRVMRNIAASECGAKLLQASPSAKHAPAILVDNNDEYMNQPCASEKWFIIETCEPVQLGIIQIANYELFSSRCKTFRVFVSDRYPAKQWEQIGVFQGQDVKGLQTFHIGGSATGRLIKYVKFEMLDHYGSEHFCPITMVRLFGLSSDEMDEPGLSPPSLSRSSLLGDIGTTLGESENELEGNTNTSELNNTHLEASMDAQSSTKATSTTASKRASARKRFKKNKTPTTTFDPPVNISSVDEEVENGDCVKGQTNTATTIVHSDKSTGLWQHATRFILGVLQSALGGKSSLTPPQVSATAAVNRTNSFTALEPTHNDFYSVIYIFSVSSSAATPPPSTDARSRGLWHLARCLVALSSSSPPLRSLAAPQRAWADCTATEFLLNLTTTSSKGSTDLLLQFQRLAAAYRNLTSAFGRWPTELMRGQVGKKLPVPEFLKPKSVIPTPSKPVVEGVNTLEQKTVESEMIKTEESPSPIESKPTSFPSQITPTPPMPLPKTTVETHEDNGAVENENLSPQSPSPSPSVQSASSKKGDEEKTSTLEDAIVLPETTTPTESPRKRESEMETVMAEGTEGEREVVLPAAMGGSWKETMYMRLNNKVLQLQSDVSVSMRYLEELSQSYKRQTERLSASFNLTTAWLKATAKGAEERDLLQQERIDALEVQLTKLLHLLAEGGVVTLAPSPSRETPDSSQGLASTTASSSVPRFRKPDAYSTSSTPSVDLQSILWSVFFQSPATASPSSSLSMPSKRIYGSPSTPNTAPAGGTGNVTSGGIKPCNTTSILSLFGRTSTTSGLSRSGTVGARLSPPASLLFRRRQLKGQKEAVTDATGPMAHLSGVGDAWMFILGVVSQHLQNFLLPETFRLWLLHLFLAVLAQTLVYVIFLRSVLRRCLPLPPLHFSPSSCEICSTFPTITDPNYNPMEQDAGGGGGGGGCEDEKKAIHPRSRSTSTSTTAPPPMAEDCRTPSSLPLPSMNQCDVAVDPSASAPVRSTSIEDLDVGSRQGEEVDEGLEAAFDPFASRYYCYYHHYYHCPYHCRHQQQQQHYHSTAKPRCRFFQRWTVIVPFCNRWQLWGRGGAEIGERSGSGGKRGPDAISQALWTQHPPRQSYPWSFSSQLLPSPVRMYMSGVFCFSDSPCIYLSSPSFQHLASSLSTSQSSRRDNYRYQGSWVRINHHCPDALSVWNDTSTWTVELANGRYGVFDVAMVLDRYDRMEIGANSTESRLQLAS